MVINGTEGEKWYKNIIRGEIAQGSQKATNPKSKINIF